MSTLFKPDDRVWVAKRYAPGTVATVRMVEGDALVQYEDGVKDSFSQKIVQEFVKFDELSEWKPEAATETPALDVGDVIVVTWGAEKYAPRQFMNFDVGPLQASTKIRPGETAEEAHARVWKWLEARAREQFTSHLTRFKSNLQDL